MRTIINKCFKTAKSHCTRPKKFYVPLFGTVYLNSHGIQLLHKKIPVREESCHVTLWFMALNQLSLLKYSISNYIHTFHNHV